MSQFKKLAIAIISVIGLSSICYAAVTPIAQTEYAEQVYRSMSEPLALATPVLPSVDPTRCEEVSAELCSAEYTCDPKNGASCEKKYCTLTSGECLEYQVCPSTFMYSAPNGDISNIKGVDSMQYCVGTGGFLQLHGIWFDTDVQLCSAQDITDSTYISKLSVVTDVLTTKCNSVSKKGYCYKSASDYLWLEYCSIENDMFQSFLFPGRIQVNRNTHNLIRQLFRISPIPIEA